MKIQTKWLFLYVFVQVKRCCKSITRNSFFFYFHRQVTPSTLPTPSPTPILSREGPDRRGVLDDTLNVLSGYLGPILDTLSPPSRSLLLRISNSGSGLSFRFTGSVLFLVRPKSCCLSTLSFLP